MITDRLSQEEFENLKDSPKDAISLGLKRNYGLSDDKVLMVGRVSSEEGPPMYCGTLDVGAGIPFGYHEHTLWGLLDKLASALKKMDPSVAC